MQSGWSLCETERDKRVKLLYFWWSVTSFANKWPLHRKSLHGLVSYVPRYEITATVFVLFSLLFPRIQNLKKNKFVRKINQQVQRSFTLKFMHKQEKPGLDTNGVHLSWWIHCVPWQSLLTSCLSHSVFCTAREMTMLSSLARDSQAIIYWTWCDSFQQAFPLLQFSNHKLSQQRPKGPSSLNESIS